MLRARAWFCSRTKPFCSSLSTAGPGLRFHSNGSGHVVRYVCTCRGSKISRDRSISCEIWNRPLRKLLKNPDTGSWFWELIFPFAWVPAKCGWKGPPVQVLCGIRVWYLPNIFCESALARIGWPKKFQRQPYRAWNKRSGLTRVKANAFVHYALHYAFMHLCISHARSSSTIRKCVHDHCPETVYTQHERVVHFSLPKAKRMKRHSIFLATFAIIGFTAKGNHQATSKNVMVFGEILDLYIQLKAWMQLMYQNTIMFPVSVHVARIVPKDCCGHQTLRGFKVSAWNV